MGLGEREDLRSFVHYAVSRSLGLCFAQYVFFADFLPRAHPARLFCLVNTFKGCINFSGDTDTQQLLDEEFQQRLDDYGPLPDGAACLYRLFGTIISLAPDEPDEDIERRFNELLRRDRPVVNTLFDKDIVHDMMARIETPPADRALQLETDAWLRRAAARLQVIAEAVGHDQSTAFVQPFRALVRMIDVECRKLTRQFPPLLKTGPRPEGGLASSDASPVADDASGFDDIDDLFAEMEAGDHQWCEPDPCQACVDTCETRRAKLAVRCTPLFPHTTAHPPPPWCALQPVLALLKRDSRRLKAVVRWDDRPEPRPLEDHCKRMVKEFQQSQAQFKATCVALHSSATRC